MEETITEFFSNGEFWAILIKVLITTLLSAGIGLLCTLIGKCVAKNKNSKITKYAKICVEAAEQKFPNEGRKMGPEKMSYVMDQLAIKFPKIKENTYLYNIAEAAVYQLNEEKRQEDAIKAFKEKYGEDPIAIKDDNNNDASTNVEENSDSTDLNNNSNNKVEESPLPSTETPTPTSTSINNNDDVIVEKKRKSTLKSF